MQMFLPQLAMPVVSLYLGLLKFVSKLEYDVLLDDARN